MISSSTISILGLCGLFISCGGLGYAWGASLATFRSAVRFAASGI